MTGAGTNASTAATHYSDANVADFYRLRWGGSDIHIGRYDSGEKTVAGDTEPKDRGMRLDRLQPEGVVQRDRVCRVRIERVDQGEARHFAGDHLSLQASRPVLVLAPQHAFQAGAAQAEFPPQNRHHQDGRKILVPDDGIDRPSESAQDAPRLVQQRLKIKPLRGRDRFETQQ